MIPMKLLEGPQVWVNELSAHRREKRTAWVEGISAIQSKFNRDYRIPYYLSDVHDDFFDRVRVPHTLVYIKNLPAAQNKELLELVLTWFGMVLVGNPFVIVVKVLYQESSSNHSEVQTGTMAVRFATVEMAELFITMFSGLGVSYEQYDTLEHLTRDELAVFKPPKARDLLVPDCY